MPSALAPKEPKKPKTAEERKKRVSLILRRLNKDYPDVDCALNHSSAWELLAATILSAQCTDKRVNMVTPELFAAYPTVQDMAVAAQPDVEQLVKTTGFFRNKAKSLIGSLILRRLNKDYPDVDCALNHSSAWELLAATILSAQCTDKRVNMVTPELFAAYPTVQDMAVAAQPDVEQLVKTTGFFRNKAKSLIGAAKGIVERFDGEVPSNMEDLLTLPGAARKTANVVLGTWFKKATGVVVDTHVARISKRLDLTRNDDPKKIEQDLMKVIPKKRWILYSHQIIWHGREVCLARRPRCGECRLADLCYSADKTA